MTFGPAINLFFDNFLYINNQQSKKKIIWCKNATNEIFIQRQQLHNQ